MRTAWEGNIERGMALHLPLDAVLSHGTSSNSAPQCILRSHVHLLFSLWASGLQVG